MPDFPNPAVYPQKTFIATWGQQCLAADVGLCQNLNAGGGAVWPAANRAIYTSIWIEQPCVARRMCFNITVTSGNFDVGIYDAKGNRIVSKGSTAMGTVNTTQIVDLTASVTGTASPVLMPGNYFLAMNVDNTTAAVKSTGINAAELCRICGIQQQAVGAVTLPATATFANPASAFMPVLALGTAATL